MHSFSLVYMQAKSIIFYFYLDYFILNYLAYIRQAEYLKRELLIKDTLDNLAEYTKNF